MFAALATLWLTLVPLVFATSPTATPPASVTRMSDADVASALRARLDSLSRADEFSGAVLLLHGDRVLLRKAYGMAVRETRTPNRPDTRFNLGSINKAFTKIAIDQLAAAGKLQYDDTIDRYLPDYPKDKGSQITIRQLLDHRAGTGHMFGPAYDAADHSKLLTVPDWVKLVRDEPLLFEPGTKQEYSNTGYILLGAIVEQVSGVSYYDYVRTHVYELAGMSATGSFARDENVPNRATGYTKRSGGDAWRTNTEFLPGRGSPAGGGYSTLDDLRRFADASRAGKFGGPGEGLAIAGGAPGTNAMLEMFGDYTVIVLANLDPPAAERVALATRGWLRQTGAVSAMSAEMEASSGRRIVRAGAGEVGAVSASEAPHGGGEPVRVVRHGGGPDDPMRQPKRTILPAWTVDVPMQKRDHMPAIDVMVNGKGPYRFAIDTGAAGAARVDSALAATLGLTKVGEVQAGDPSGKNMIPMAMVSIDSISFGGVRFEGMNAAVRNYNDRAWPGRDHIDGILGFGLFAECLWTLDYPGQRVRVGAGALPEANGRDVLAFRDERGIPVVSLVVSGNTLDAHVDAGAIGGWGLPDSLEKHLAFKAPLKVVGQARTVSNTFDVRSGDLQGDIALGSFRFTNPTVRLQPMLPDANVGSRILEDFAVTFDTKNHRMKLARGTASTEAAK
jgi:CubicO group peptidase (beta-lactamase class C family)